MERKDYIAARQALKDQYSESLTEIERDFIFNNSKYKFGDIISNGKYHIKVMKLKMGYDKGCPEPVYCGWLVKQDSLGRWMPDKNNERNIWETDIVVPKNPEQKNQENGTE